MRATTLELSLHGLRAAGRPRAPWRPPGLADTLVRRLPTYGGAVIGAGAALGLVAIAVAGIVSPMQLSPWLAAPLGALAAYVSERSFAAMGFALIAPETRRAWHERAFGWVDRSGETRGADARGVPFEHPADAVPEPVEERSFWSMLFSGDGDGGDSGGGD